MMLCWIRMFMLLSKLVCPRLPYRAAQVGGALSALNAVATMLKAFCAVLYFNRLVSRVKPDCSAPRFSSPNGCGKCRPDAVRPPVPKPLPGGWRSLWTHSANSFLVLRRGIFSHADYHRHNILDTLSGFERAHTSSRFPLSDLKNAERSGTNLFHFAQRPPDQITGIHRRPDRIAELLFACLMIRRFHTAPAC